MKFSELKFCPFCDNDVFYTKETVTGTINFNERFDGYEADNTEMYDSLSFTEGVRCYCRNCNKYLGNRKTDELSKQCIKKLKNK